METAGPPVDYSTASCRETMKEGGAERRGRVKIPEVIIREIAVEPCWWMIMWASRERRGF